MLGILEQIHQHSKQPLEQDQLHLISTIQQTIQAATYSIIVDQVKQKDYLLILQTKTSLFLEQEMAEVITYLENRNKKVYNDLIAGNLNLSQKQPSPSNTKMTDSKMVQIQNKSKAHSFNEEEELRNSFMAKQLIRKKKEQKLERHKRLQKILQRETQFSRLKQQQQKKQSENICWERNQKSLQKFRIKRQRYEQEQIQNSSKLESIKQFQIKINKISNPAEKDFKSLDIERTRALQTSRTQALVQKRNELKVNYREIDQHDQRYLSKLQILESDRLSRLNRKQSEDLQALKLIKPFNQVYVQKDHSQEVRNRVQKMKQFKQYVRANIKPKVDPQKRKQIIKSIINQDANKYRSLGFMKQEENGVIVEKSLPKIDLRSIGNEYMKHAKKMKSRQEHRVQLQEQQKTVQKHFFVDYLKDLKKEQRKRMSRSQQIQRSQGSVYQKVKRIEIAIGCLQNQIKKHQSLIRNSHGLSSDRVDELKVSIDQKNVQITNLKLTMVKVLDDEK